jgi:hypothetical protein
VSKSNLVSAKSVSLEKKNINTNNNDTDMALIETNDKSQEEISGMLRLVIANFCEQHFVKQIQKAKLQSTSSLAQNTTTTTISTKTTNVLQEDNLNTNTNTNNNTTKSNEEKEANLINKDEEEAETEETIGDNKELIEMSTSKKEDNVEEVVTTTLDSQEDKKTCSSENSNTSSDVNTNSNRDTPPPSSSSPSSSSSSSDIAISCESPLSSKSNEITNSTSSQSVGDIAQKTSASTTTEDHHTKTSDILHEINSSTDIHNRFLQLDEDIDVPPSSKLWSTLLIGADKLEIFGSIHVRTNNVRLLSCLIDEQLSLIGSSSSSSQNSCTDSSLSYSSAASISSSSGGGGCGVDLVSCSSKLMMMNKLAMSQRHQKYLANENARLMMTDAALKQVNAGLAAASILGAGVNGRSHISCHNNNNNTNNNTNSLRHNYNHNHSHQKRNRRYRNHHHSHNKSHSHSQHHHNYIRENNQQQRCCQVNTIYSSNRKLESTNAINSQTTTTIGSSGSRRKNTHSFATPRNHSTSTANAAAAAIAAVAYTDSEQNEYIDDEDTAVILMNANNKQSKLISKENDHVLVINNGESAANVNKVAIVDMDEYDNEMIEAGEQDDDDDEEEEEGGEDDEEEDEENVVQDEYGNYNVKQKKSRKLTSITNGKSNDKAKNGDTNDETNMNGEF